MDGRLQGDAVIAGGDARQRFYDARGYGRPLSGNEIALSRVEAAHLLFYGNLDSIDGMDFREFFARSTGGGFAARFLVYKDLRDRGFYLSPAREGWTDDSSGDFVVYPRGKGPRDDAVLHRVRVVGERERIALRGIGDVVLAVVDEESEITYFETDRPDVTGSSESDLPENVPAVPLADRVLVWDPPAELHERGFYGRPLADADPNTDTPAALQLSLVEAAYLTARGVVDVDGGYDGVVARGRETEGERFDRRLRVYADLRERGVVPKTGFKFGADFRTYADVESVDDLGHSELLVRVLPPDVALSSRDLSLDVRLAHGVRKRMVFALTDPNDDTELTWLSVGRLTP